MEKFGGNYMKTLAFILNYNTPDMTDRLYESLAPYCGDICDLLILDNGSDKNLRSKYPTIHIKENCYWGGGLSFAFEYVLSHEQYDSLIFLNSDINLNGENFIKTLREDIFVNDYAMASPCVTDLLVGKKQKSNRHSNSVFRQMANWYTNDCRTVKMLDLQCPIFHRKVIEKIKSFDSLLNYGWGIGFYCGHVCEKYGWKTCVDDRIHIEHIGQASWEGGKMNSKFEMDAENRMMKFLKRKRLISNYKKFMKEVRLYNKI
jgi:hypothetical protein